MAGSLMDPSTQGDVISNPAWWALALSDANTVWLTVTAWRRRRAARAVGPHDDVRAALTSVRDHLDEVISGEGLASDRWKAADAASRRRRLADVASRVGDRSLRALLGTVAAEYQAAWDAAPDPAGPRAYGLGDDYPDMYAAEDRAISAARATSLGIAVEAHRSAESALARLNELERRTN